MKKVGRIINEIKMKKETPKVKMTFEVIEDLDVIVDTETLKKEYKGDIHKICKYLYKQEGNWWSNPMKLVKTEIIEK